MRSPLRVKSAVSTIGRVLLVYPQLQTYHCNARSDVKGQTRKWQSLEIMVLLQRLWGPGLDECGDTGIISAINGAGRQAPVHWKLVYFANRHSISISDQSGPAVSHACHCLAELGARAIGERGRQYRQWRKVAIRFARDASGGRALKAGTTQQTRDRSAEPRASKERWWRQWGRQFRWSMGSDQCRLALRHVLRHGGHYWQQDGGAIRHRSS